MPFSINIIDVEVEFAISSSLEFESASGHYSFCTFNIFFSPQFNIFGVKVIVIGLGFRFGVRFKVRIQMFRVRFSP